MVTFYHRFLPAAASIMEPLYEAASIAFESIKKALANATMLVHLKCNAPTTLKVDASETAVGGVLEQLVNKQWQAIAFFSCRLRSPEQKCSTFDRELLALYLAIRHFRYFIEGRSFTAFTDHKTLTFAFSLVFHSRNTLPTFQRTLHKYNT